MPVAIVLMAVLMVSCKKDPVTPTVTGGKLTGNIQTWDDKTTSTTDQAGITVAVTNTTGYTATATTDATGKYSFDNLPYDIYDFTLSKSGYGTLKVYGVANTNGGTGVTTIVPTIGFGKLSTTTVTSLSVSGNTFNGQPGVTFNYGISPAPSTSSRAFVRYFLSTSATVSNTNYTAFSTLYNFSNLSNVTGFSANDLIGMGFTSGQTVYVKMYGDSFKSNEYQDPNTGKWVFPNINTTTAAAVSFIVP